MTNPLRVGVARRDITPALGTPLMGYANRERVAKSVRDPLNVTTLVFEQDGQRAGLVTLDIITVDDPVIAKMRGAIHAATGIAPANITLVCSQTHRGPGTPTCGG